MPTAIDSPAAATAVVAEGKLRARRSETLTGWAFAAPFAVLFVLFLVVPAIYGLYLSFTGETLTGANSDLVGFANYTEALTDPDMWRSLGNTLWFTFLSTVPLVVLSLAFALLVNLGLPGRWLWRLSFFLPYLLASTVVVLFWSWMYNPKIGLINGVLAELGIAPVAWLQDPKVAMFSVVITTLWWTIGFNFLLYLAALQNIPEQQFEAAAIDGAGKWRQLFAIVIPQLAPTTALILTLQVLASLKVFDQIYMLTNGGPAGSTRSIVQYIYESGFTGYRFGFSSAISYLFFAIIVLVSLAQYRLLNRRSGR
ncbi:carbohydrate ABC transporter permease [Kribbella sp. CA-293567]|uniref:carbohydrate ABC transporter permease n=1 Tax=Kribbella sp. CA-293567 TaxID=3002436 RepID=UPI0022DDD353|nr:sugar ABC transporter permease [Kribbella sp. CA-293567]WBQ01926.1 sugar ABC transporter permease [Kribbella sp. CA-293567]